MMRTIFQMVRTLVIAGLVTGALMFFFSGVFAPPLAY